MANKKFTARDGLITQNVDFVSQDQTKLALLELLNDGELSLDTTINASQIKDSDNRVYSPNNKPTKSELNLGNVPNEDATDPSNWDYGLTGADTVVVTGTAGTGGNLTEWNADGDAVDSGAATSNVARRNADNDFGGSKQRLDSNDGNWVTYDSNDGLSRIYNHEDSGGNIVGGMNAEGLNGAGAFATLNFVNWADLQFKGNSILDTTNLTVNNGLIPETNQDNIFTGRNRITATEPGIEFSETQTTDENWSLFASAGILRLHERDENFNFIRSSLQVHHGGGLELGDPTGDDQGAGTVNAEGVYQNGQEIPQSVQGLGTLSSNTTVDPNNGKYIQLTLGASIQLSLSALAGIAELVTIEVTQDGTGGRDLTWDTTNILFPGGTAPAETQTASATDLFEYRWNGTNFILTNFISDVK